MKINHILFPVDFSECSAALNAEVEWVAQHFNADVTLLHVFEIPVTWYGTGQAPLINTECLQEFASESKKRLVAYPIQLPANRVKRVIEEGDAAWSIKKWVEEHEVDLVMMGTHGYGSMRRMILGSNAMKVLHDVDCPVWTHRTLETARTSAMKIGKILCALELTAETVPLLRAVKSLAQEFSASVRVLHSVPQTNLGPYSYFDADLHAYIRKAAADDLSKCQHEAETDFPVTITDGFIGKESAEFVADDGADLVVIGRGKAQAIFGPLRTHAYDIIRQVSCPVLSFPASWAERNQTASVESVSRESTANQPDRLTA